MAKNTVTVNRNILLQDVGILLFLACVFAGTMITALSPEQLLMQNAVMLVGMFFIAVLAVFRMRYLAAVVTAFQILAFTAYKLYTYSVSRDQIEITAYFWAFLLLLLVLGLVLFIRENERTESLNTMLRDQVEELVMVDPLTGLNNLRSMYNDLARTMALARRNGTPIGLMLIKLRYADELRNVLSRRGFNSLKQRLGEIAEDTLRMEDRVYSIDNDGSIGVIYISKPEGAATVKNRLLSAITERNAFEGITDKPIKVEVRIAFLPFDDETIKNPVEFKQRVENELQYDV